MPSITLECRCETDCFESLIACTATARKCSNNESHPLHKTFCSSRNSCSRSYTVHVTNPQSRRDKQTEFAYLLMILIRLFIVRALMSSVIRCQNVHPKYEKGRTVHVCCIGVIRITEMTYLWMPFYCRKSMGMFHEKLDM